jgi:hypothetical protein
MKAGLSLLFLQLSGMEFCSVWNFHEKKLFIKFLMGTLHKLRHVENFIMK